LIFNLFFFFFGAKMEITEISEIMADLNKQIESQRIRRKTTKLLLKNSRQ